ncbi:lysoplasmalogenase [Nocardiopsis sp. HNM0947]|uniref:Lysoplasmalogenase n=1 Tax=Nocardiopsis coralli TaxID=2772213 RepID=A0ABR9P8L0_9ACTN|nr:lysoplasmalogenase [Nocardiopsis coralli]MBE3000175.1 lysoplasmalogenase [Nocardiopsis coralli]
MIPRRPLPRLLLTAFAALCLVHLTVQVTGPAEWSRPTQGLLMPVLAALVVSAVPRPYDRLTWLVLAALAFSWLGDTVPVLADGDTAMLVLIGFFLVAQVVYAIAFWPLRGESILHRRRGLVVVYALVVGVLVGVCLPGAGPLVVPAVLYGVVLGTMAVLATGVHRLAAVGAVLFVFSDALIALRAFVPVFDLPHDGVWVMATYTAAQVLIVLGVLARKDGERIGTPGPLPHGEPAREQPERM